MHWTILNKRERSEHMEVLHAFDHTGTFEKQTDSWDMVCFARSSLTCTSLLSAGTRAGAHLSRRMHCPSVYLCFAGFSLHASYTWNDCCSISFLAVPAKPHHDLIDVYLLRWLDEKRGCCFGKQARRASEAHRKSRFSSND